MFSSLLLLLIAASSIQAAFDPLSSKNSVVYWGQNSALNQGSLASYCTDNVDIVILSFMNVFPGVDGVPGLNFANACGNVYPGTKSLLHCPNIANDIKTCQSLGKRVLLSLGGAIGDYGFSSNTEATTFAETLWNLVGEGNGTTRPFDDAVVDGFDLDIENGSQTGYVSLVSKLRDLFKTSPTSKQYFISASPQCVYPDSSLSDVLENSILDWIFIQFYNNACSIGTGFNWNTWSNYAKTVSKNKDVKLYLGVAGSSSAAGSGYVEPSVIKSTVDQISSNCSFGGISQWDASQAFSNVIDGSSFASKIKNILLSAPVNPVCSPISSGSASATSSTIVSLSISTPQSISADPATSNTVVSSSISTLDSISSASVTPSTIVSSSISTPQSISADPATSNTVAYSSISTLQPISIAIYTSSYGNATTTTNDAVLIPTLISNTVTRLVTIEAITTTVSTITSCKDHHCTGIPTTLISTYTTLTTTIETLVTLTTTVPCTTSTASTSPSPVSAEIPNTHNENPSISTIDNSLTTEYITIGTITLTRIVPCTTSIESATPSAPHSHNGHSSIETSLTLTLTKTVPTSIASASLYPSSSTINNNGLSISSNVTTPLVESSNSGVSINAKYLSTFIVISVIAAFLI